MANKSVKNLGKERAVSEYTTQKGSVPSIGKTLRNGALAIVAAGLVMEAPTVKAQFATNTIDLGGSSQYTMGTWNPQETPRFGNGTSASLSYGAFNPLLGTLDSVTLALTVSYTANDMVGAASGVTYSGSDILSVSPILTLPFGSVGTYSSILNGNPSTSFSYDINGVYPDYLPTQTGTSTYNLTLTGSALSAFLSSGDITFSLANGSTPSPDAPYQIPGGDNVYAPNSTSWAENTLSSANLTENVVDASMSEVYTTPEPSTIALTGLGAAALVLLRRRKS